MMFHVLRGAEVLCGHAHRVVGHVRRAVVLHRPTQRGPAQQ